MFIATLAVAERVQSETENGVWSGGNVFLRMRSFNVDDVDKRERWFVLSI